LPMLHTATSDCAGARACRAANHATRSSEWLAWTKPTTTSPMTARGAAVREITVRSRHGVTVVGDYVRFADPEGVDLAKVAIPWVTPEDRDELARRIGQLIDRAPALGARPTER